LQEDGLLIFCSLGFAKDSVNRVIKREYANQKNKKKYHESGTFYRYILK